MTPLGIKPTTFWLVAQCLRISDMASVNSEARISPSLAYRQCTAQRVKLSNRQLFMLHTELQFDHCAWHQFTWKYVVPVFVMYDLFFVHVF